MKKCWITSNDSRTGVCLTRVRSGPTRRGACWRITSGAMATCRRSEGAYWINWTATQSLLLNVGKRNITGPEPRRRRRTQANIATGKSKSQEKIVAAELKRFIIGRALRTEQATHERLTKKTALAVFSSDALSSTAYATEEILLVLAVAAAATSGASFSFVVPVSVGIAVLLAIVATSYRQTIHAYPSGGGAYIVAKENLGQTPGLIAGASLLVDYVLTVSVSIAAGVAAITSAV